MFLTCKKCGKQFDPGTHTAHCSPHYGHAPVMSTEQNITGALLEKKSVTPKKKEFQSDFRLIWDEPQKQ